MADETNILFKNLDNITGSRKEVSSDNRKPDQKQVREGRSCTDNLKWPLNPKITQKSSGESKF